MKKNCSLLVLLMTLIFGVSTVSFSNNNLPGKPGKHKSAKKTKKKTSKYFHDFQH